jgi:hypothetical protein
MASHIFSTIKKLYKVHCHHALPSRATPGCSASGQHSTVHTPTRVRARCVHRAHARTPSTRTELRGFAGEIIRSVSLLWPQCATQRLRMRPSQHVGETQQTTTRACVRALTPRWTHSKYNGSCWDLASMLIADVFMHSPLDLQPRPLLRHDTLQRYLGIQPRHETKWCMLIGGHAESTFPSCRSVRVWEPCSHNRCVGQLFTSSPVYSVRLPSRLII